MLNNVVDNIEQCGQHNKLLSSTGCAFLDVYVILSLGFIKTFRVKPCFEIRLIWFFFKLFQKLLPGLKDLFQCGAVVKQHSEGIYSHLIISRKETSYWPTSWPKFGFEDFVQDKCAA